jgi:nickel-dependent lactate racemase
MPTIRFAFGKTGIPISVPDDLAYEVVEARSASALRDVDASLEHALDNPIGPSSLQAVAEGKSSAAISVCDITRPAPNWLTLPPLLRRLHRAGIPAEGITILIATGLHRGATEAEINTILGPEVAAKYRVINHDARDAEHHRHLGSTKRGTPVYIDERFMAADLHISLGFIEQHLMLGFSGGRKLVAPGLAGQQTIKTIHSPRFMREPLATEGSTGGNPLHSELLEIAQMARHDFILDVTLTKEREVSGVFAGDPVMAHAAGVDFLRTTSLEKLSGLADVVITSAAGHPLDLTFYQTIKGITAAEHIAKPGGRILVIGECAEGIGSSEFAKKLETYSGPREYLDEIEGKAVVVDQWQLEKLALTELKNELFFYTPGISKTVLGCLAERSFQDLSSAISAVLAGVPSNARVALVPDGPYVFARVMN